MIRGDITQACILVVDDEPANVELLVAILREWKFHNVHGLGDPRRLADLAAQYPPDLILLDLHMPGMDGWEILANLQANGLAPHGSVPVLVLTADITAAARERALRLGARDFLTKPFDVVEVMLRVRNHLEVRRDQRLLETHGEELEKAVEERTREIGRKAEELDSARIETLHTLAKAAEFRDDDTGKHTLRVGYNSALLAEALDLDPLFVHRMREAAPLHDIGKIGIPDAILLKPGKLTSDEFAVMKRHAAIGGDILSNSNGDVLRLAEEIARFHHEKWDGSGYVGIAGADIPLSGRIVAVADVFDALTHQRPYKVAWSREDAAREVMAGAGRHFDPDLIRVFASVLPRLRTDSSIVTPDPDA